MVYWVSFRPDCDAVMFMSFVRTGLCFMTDLFLVLLFYFELGLVCCSYI